MQKHTNNARTWTLAVLSTVAILVAVVICINVTVDAYGIIRTDFSRQFQVPNMHFIKIKFLLENKDKFDSFVFGSSRPEKIDPRHIPGGRFYDVTYPIGVPQEHLANLKFLLKNGVTIRNVMLGLDEFSYRFDPAERVSDLALQPHYAVSGKDPRTFYAEYFLKLRKLFPQLKAYIKHNYTDRHSPEETRYQYDMFESGRLLCPDCDADIEKNRESVIKAAYSDPAVKIYGQNFEPSLQAVREFVAVCRQHSIRLTVFINPLHRFAYLDASLKDLARFKRELAEITPYWDFSGLNVITTNNYYYYETSHYRPLVGDMMLKVMFGSPAVPVPPGFGRAVTAANVDNHLRELCVQLRNRHTDLTLKADNAAYADFCLGTPVVTTAGVL